MEKRTPPFSDLGLSLLAVDDLGGDDFGGAGGLHRRAQTLRLRHDHLRDRPRRGDDGGLRPGNSLQGLLPLKHRAHNPHTLLQDQSTPQSETLTHSSESSKSPLSYGTRNPAALGHASSETSANVCVKR